MELSREKFLSILQDIINNPIKLDLYYSEEAYLRRHQDRYWQSLRFFSENNIDIVKKMVLDVGSYPGHLSILLKQLYKANVSGLGKDFPQDFTDRLSKYNIRLYHANVEKDRFPLANNSVDIVFCTEILEHLYLDPIHMLSEIHRVLKPKGYLFLSTPNFSRLANRALMLLGKDILWEIEGKLGYFDIDIYDRHNREYNKSEITKMLFRSGFKKTTKIKGYSRPVAIVYANLIARLLNILSRISVNLAENFFILVRK